MESSSKGRISGIREEPIAKERLVKVKVRKVRKVNVIVDGDGGA